MPNKQTPVAGQIYYIGVFNDIIYTKFEVIRCALGFSSPKSKSTRP